jgi:hypothetical protein
LPRDEINFLAFDDLSDLLERRAGFEQPVELTPSSSARFDIRLIASYASEILLRGAPFGDGAEIDPGVCPL